MEYGEAADQVAASPSDKANSLKKTRGVDASGAASPTQRRYGTCGETGHNVRTCLNDSIVLSKSDTSTQYTFSDISDISR